MSGLVLVRQRRGSANGVLFITLEDETGIAHLELREPPIDGTFGVGDVDPLAARIRPAFKGPLLLNSDFDVARAQAGLDAGTGDAVTFGRPFIASPDLPRRIAEGLPLASDDRRTWFTQGGEGYVDYPPAPTRLPTGRRASRSPGRFLNRTPAGSGPASR